MYVLYIRSYVYIFIVNCSDPSPVAGVTFSPFSDTTEGANISFNCEAGLVKMCLCALVMVHGYHLIQCKEYVLHQLQVSNASYRILVFQIIIIMGGEVSVYYGDIIPDMIMVW